ncbi:type IV secretory system conjugative DNA transfer family protein [Aureimonas pseudogalii]|uniref:Type IV secretion system protein VirD4 n=1 Tax=Aureimonas pseudogalii TaxID=1744844 RepID=A0A7W6H8C9_9HYPH|nr:type IV secretory system conjugative DNA transfer family protein [Aureimonas pseudogalii]MBB4000490.1 type IV secretion system protein VirD4 [Aureimonas pseudogalii]
MTLALARAVARLLVLLWPLYALLATRWLGDALWFSAASTNAVLAAFWQTAPGFGRALGPLVTLALAVILCRTAVTGRTVVTLASLTLAGSVLWSLGAEIARLQPYLGVSSLRDIVFAFDRGPILAALAAAFAIHAANRILDGRSVWIGPLVKRSSSGTHGQADWLGMDQASDLLGSGDIILGEAYSVDGTKLGATRFDPSDRSTWGEGGQHPLLRTDGLLDSGHVLACIGSGGGKTASLVIPTAASWQAGLVVLDIKGEVHDRVARLRASRGRRVVRLSPGDASSASFNALDWIDPSTDRALIDIRRVVSWLMGETPTEKASSNQYFRDTSAALIAAVLADVIFDETLADEDRTLTTVRRFLTLPRPLLLDHLADIHAKGPTYGFGFPAQIAGNLKGITEKQFDGFYGQAGTATAWLSVPSLAAIVSAGTPTTFRTRALRSGKLDVFLCIDLGTLNDFPELARLVIGSLLNELYLAKGQVAGRTLFLVDEAARLGYMRMLEEARDAGRGFKINLMLMFQTLGQMDVYGKSGVRQWMDVAAIKVFSSIGDPDSAEAISRQCGEFTALSHGTSTSSGSSHRRDELFGSASRSAGSSTGEVARRLIRPEEILTLRGDEQLILVKGQKPIRCGKAFWFRRPGMKATLDTSSFERGRT